MFIFASILSCFAAAAIAGMLYQWSGAKRDRERLAGSGRWVEIANGCSLYLVEKGSGTNRAL